MMIHMCPGHKVSDHTDQDCVLSSGPGLKSRKDTRHFYLLLGSSAVSNNCNVTARANWTGQCICIDMLDKISSKTKDPCTAPLYEWDTHCNCLSINSEKVKILSFTFFRQSSVHAGLLRRKDN